MGLIADLLSSFSPSFRVGVRPAVTKFSLGLTRVKFNNKTRGLSPLGPPPVLPSASEHSVGTPEEFISRLNTQPVGASVQRFTRDVTTAGAWLEVRMVRYSFPVGLLHPRLSAGLSRRFRSDPDCRRRPVPVTDLLIRCATILYIHDFRLG